MTRLGRRLETLDNNLLSNGERHGEGNDTPLQYSCLENPRNGGAWWASIYGVTQGWTRLTRLSSSKGETKVLERRVHYEFPSNTVEYTLE